MARLIVAIRGMGGFPLTATVGRVRRFASGPAAPRTLEARGKVEATARGKRSLVRATVMLADHAQVQNGKLFISGGGWSRIVHPGHPQALLPLAIAIKIEVPWDQANRRHTWRLALFDADGQPVTLHTPAGDQPFFIQQDFEVGRPAGLEAGTPLDFPLALNVPLPLAPAKRYVFRLSIDGESSPDWEAAFSVAPHAPG
jgi:hypothetical protein